MKKTLVVFCTENVFFIDKNKNTFESKRSYEIAQYLASEFQVTLLIPNDTPIPQNLQLPYKIDTYNAKVANWNWSEELDRKLKKYDFAIIQPTNGIGIQNFTVLPSEINVIVDGWSLYLLEYSGYLLTQPKIARKVFWKKSYAQYKDLLIRANCILLANDRQRYFYEGLFYGIDKLDCSTFQFSITLKVPFGIDGIYNVQKKSKNKKINLLWEGPIYPWDFPETLIKELAEHPQINIDFYQLKHPAYTKTHTNYFKQIFDSTQTISNINVLSTTDTLDYSKYDAGICLTREWIISNYIHKPNIMNLISNNLPVLLSKGDPLLEDTSLRSQLFPISTGSIKNDIENCLEDLKKYSCSDEDLYNLLYTHNWEVSLQPLKDYINTF